MNEYERRVIELAQNHMDLTQAAQSINAAAVVEPFGYSVRIGTTANPLVSGVTQQGVITIQADSWFVLSYISGAVTVPATANFYNGFAQPCGNISFQLQDTGTGDIIYSKASPAALAIGTPYVGFSGVLPFTGSPAIPFLLPFPRVIPPNTNIKIEATQMGFNAVTNPQPTGFFLNIYGSRVGRV